MFLEELRRNLKGYLLVFLILSLFGWSLTASMSLINKKDRVIVVRVDDSGTERVSEDNISDRTEQDLKNLAHYFVHYFYSYDSENFEDRKAKALMLTNRDLMKKLYKEAVIERDSLSSENRVFNQEVLIKEVKVLNKTNIKILVEKGLSEIIETKEVDPETGEKKQRSDYNSVKSQILISVNPVSRLRNIYGFEINSLKEQKRY